MKAPPRSTFLIDRVTIYVYVNIIDHSPWLGMRNHYVIVKVTNNTRLILETSEVSTYIMYPYQVRAAVGTCIRA